VNKVIPIKLERATQPRNTRIVEWRLSNICNFDCTFCPSEFKDGSKRFLDYNVYTSTVKQLIAQDPNKKVWFQFTGGEPTLYPKLIELLKYIKDLGGYTSMISNGSRTIRWWKELAEAKVLDRLYISHHPEQGAKVEHTIEVNNLMQATNTLVTVFVTTQADPVLYEAAIDAHTKILRRGNAISSLKPITDSNMLFQQYSQEQLKKIQDNLYVRSSLYKLLSQQKLNYLKTIPWYQTNVTMTYSDGSTKTLPSQDFVQHQETKFKGWECDIGKDLLMIEVDDVLRSMCGQGGVIANVHDVGFTWATDSVICDREECNCSLDVQEPKRYK
jgi:sulfatase maturation enzyme AslB (radical SAM superfamily)